MKNTVVDISYYSPAQIATTTRRKTPPLRFVASSLHLPSIGIFGFRVNVNETDINSY